MNSNTIINAFALMSALIISDYITGIIKAVINKNVQSSAMRIGLWHKFVYYIVAAIALIIDTESHAIDLGFTVPLFIPTIAGICLIEISSIMENAGEIDPELKTSGIFNLFNKEKDNNNEPKNTPASA
jgi:toxin secretion/phage lysis holin